MGLFTKQFWMDAAERSISTFAQAALTVFGGDAINVWHVDWKMAAGVGLGGAALSLLKSVVAANVGDKGSASLVELDHPGRHAAP